MALQLMEKPTVVSWLAMKYLETSLVDSKKALVLVGQMDVVMDEQWVGLMGSLMAILLEPTMVIRLAFLMAQHNHCSKS
jgi:hypothetical protein